MAQRTPVARTVVAAGAVVVRDAGGHGSDGGDVGAGEPEVLLVHRPRYDDWSLPKGKVDPGEHPAVTAVREVEEETGLGVRLGAALPDQAYDVGRGRSARPKTVHYWLASVVGDDDVRGYRRADEIDEVCWLPWREALARLTYDRDRATVRGAAVMLAPSDTLVVLRHGDARARQSWRRDDALRPLSAAGRRQARALVPVLSAYGVRRVVTSSAARCVATVAPYAEQHGRRVRTREALTEDGATQQGVTEVVDRLRDLGRPAVLCAHRPVLPLVWDALGTPQARLEPGGMLVVQRRGGLVVSCRELPAPRT